MEALDSPDVAGAVLLGGCWSAPGPVASGARRSIRLHASDVRLRAYREVRRAWRGPPLSNMLLRRASNSRLDKRQKKCY